jgi:Flp pilus assembly protein TadG
MMRTRLRNERGNALIETAITVPIVLLIAVGIFEFGRAYQTQQVLTNAAREGARQAVIEGVSDATVTSIVRNYLTSGGLTAVNPVISRTISMNPAGGCPCGSRVTINYPFSFIVLQPVARLVARNSTAGSAITMQASAIMRNE